MRTDFFPLLCLVVVGSEIRDPRSGIRENFPDLEHCVGHSFLCYYLGRKRKVIKVISHHLFTNIQMELGTVCRSAIAQCTTCRVFNKIEGRNRRLVICFGWTGNADKGTSDRIWSGSCSSNLTVLVIAHLLYTYRIVMSTISKRKHKCFDIEAYYRNESRTFRFGLLITGTKAKRFDFFRKILYCKQIVSVLA